MKKGLRLTQFLAKFVYGKDVEIVRHSNYGFIIPWLAGYRLFNPLSKIEHAYMVEHVIDNMGKSERYAMELAYVTDENFEFDFMNMYAYLHASAEQRCIAAVRILATEEQRKDLINE